MDRNISLLFEREQGKIELKQDTLVQLQKQIEQVAKLTSVLIECYFINQTIYNQERFDIQSILDTVLTT